MFAKINLSKKKVRSSFKIIKRYIYIYKRMVDKLAKQAHGCLLKEYCQGIGAVVESVPFP